MYGTTKLWKDLTSIKRKLAKTQKRQHMKALEEELKVMESTIQCEIEEYQSKFSNITTYKKFFYKQRATHINHKLYELMAIRYEVLKLKERISL